MLLRRFRGKQQPIIFRPEFAPDVFVGIFGHINSVSGRHPQVWRNILRRKRKVWQSPPERMIIPWADTGWSIGNITAMNNNINYTKIPK